MSYLTYINEINILIPLGTWISIGELDVNFGILLDSLSMVVIVPVGIVTLLVLFYAIDYMKDDPNRNRFLMILSVFAIFMTILVISENYLMMFIGWEFVGIISYLLISFWSTRIAANKNALSAILLNRMGDTFFVICLGTMITVFHALDFDTISLMTPHIDTYILNILALLLLLAATAKSAQLGLHAWLLGAMEGKIWLKESNQVINNIPGGVLSAELSSSHNKIKNKTNNLFFKRHFSTIVYDYIWVYNINTQELINNKPYISKSECSRDLGVNRGSILKYINSGEIFKYKYLFSYKELTKEELLSYKIISNKTLEVITGELLGDGYIKRLKNTARLEFTFSSKILHYVNYLKFNMLKEICNDTKPTPWPKDNPSQYWFSSISMPILQNMHDEWYKLNIDKKDSSNKYIKILPSNIYDLLTPISIAHWLMGDGYYETRSYTTMFCTDNFTKDEISILVDILYDKFNIEATIMDRKYKDKFDNDVLHFRLKINKYDLDKLIKLVKPHMIPEMYYKLGIKD